MITGGTSILRSTHFLNVRSCSFCWSGRVAIEILSLVNNDGDIAPSIGGGIPVENSMKD